MSYYRRRGILDTILLGANAVMGIANFMGQRQTRQAQREAQDIDTAIKVAKAAREINPGQPVGIAGPIGEKLTQLGMAKQVTPEARAGAGMGAVAQQFPSQEGGLTKPGSQEDLAHKQVYRQGVASLPESGAYLPAAQRQMGIMDAAGNVTFKNLPPGVEPGDVQKLSRVPQHILFNRQFQPVYQGPDTPHVMPEGRMTPEEYFAREQPVWDYKRTHPKPSVAKDRYEVVEGQDGHWYKINLETNEKTDLGPFQKKGTSTNLQKQAMTNAIRIMQKDLRYSLKPDAPENQQKLQDEFDNQLKILQGQGGGGGGTTSTTKPSPKPTSVNDRAKQILLQRGRSFK